MHSPHVPLVFPTHNTFCCAHDLLCDFGLLLNSVGGFVVVDFSVVCVWVAEEICVSDSCVCDVARFDVLIKSLSALMYSSGDMSSGDRN